MAALKVGAATETEMKEKKARVEDALHATRAAIEVLLTTEALIAEKPEKKKGGPGSMPDMGDMEM